jgi:hypothetical protein
MHQQSSSVSPGGRPPGIWLGKPRFQVGFAAVCALILVLFCADLLHSYQDGRFLLGHGTKASATVQATSCGKASHATVSFTSASGGSVTDQVQTDGCATVGSRIAILYDPAHLSTANSVAVTESETEDRAIPILVAVTGVAFLVFWWRLPARRFAAKQR